MVVSPHSDDAVLSLGAAITSWVRGGAVVELLTVLALDPESPAAAGGWDGRAGFATETRVGETDRGDGLPFEPGSVKGERDGAIDVPGGRGPADGHRVGGAGFADAERIDGGAVVLNVVRTAEPDEGFRSTAVDAEDQ